MLKSDVKMLCLLGVAFTVWHRLVMDKELKVNTVGKYSWPSWSIL